MDAKLLDRHGERTYVLVFDSGEEVSAGLQAFAEEAQLSAARFTAIGALSDLVLGFFDLEQRDYQKIAIREQVEVLMLSGNVALHQDQRKIHAHIVVGKRDGTAHGGHLLEAHVRPTLEVMLVESPADMRRYTDEATRLALLRPQG